MIHTQHTSLMFNECLFHLCDYTCSNVMCILNYLSIKPNKNFEYFICFWKRFYAFLYLEFLPKMFISFFYQKNSFRGIFASMSRVTSSRENDDGKFRKHWNSYREFRDCLTSKFYPQNYYVLQWPFSWVTLREAYQRKTRFCSF